MHLPEFRERKWLIYNRPHSWSPCPYRNRALGAQKRSRRTDFCCRIRRVASPRSFGASPYRCIMLRPSPMKPVSSSAAKIHVKPACVNPFVIKEAHLRHLRQLDLASLGRSLPSWMFHIDLAKRRGSLPIASLSNVQLEIQNLPCTAPLARRPKEKGMSIALNSRAEPVTCRIGPPSDRER